VLGPQDRQRLFCCGCTGLGSVGDGGAVLPVNFDPGGLGTDSVEGDDDRADDHNQSERHDSPRRTEAVDIDQHEEKRRASSDSEAHDSARCGSHEPSPAVEPLSDHRARGKREQALSAESQTAKSDGHNNETDGGTQRPNCAQCDEGRRKAERCGESNHPRSVPVNRSTAGSKEEAAHSGADEVGNRQLQPGEPSCRDEVVGEDTDTGGLAGY
jgi:hypothetical protein